MNKFEEPFGREYSNIQKWVTYIQNWISKLSILEANNDFKPVWKIFEYKFFMIEEEWERYVISDLLRQWRYEEPV